MLVNWNLNKNLKKTVFICGNRVMKYTLPFPPKYKKSAFSEFQVNKAVYQEVRGFFFFN